MPVKHPIIELNNRVYFYNYDTSLCYNNSIIIIEEEQLMTSILIVEDDNDINNLICNTLKAEGYQCERAFDGKEGDGQN